MGTSSAQAWGLLGPASTFLSIFVYFFAEPAKRYTRDPSQKHPGDLTISKEDTTEALPHTDILPVPATEVKTHWPQPLLFFFNLKETPQHSELNVLSGLPEPRLQKATAKTKKKEKQTHRNPPSSPPKLSRGRGAERERGTRRTGKAAGCSPFLPPFYSC